jgi:phosphodiesterase/alkaline phosphatase D-like protein
VEERGLALAAELGAVTDRSVRLWARAPGAARLALVLEVDGRRPLTASLALEPDRDWTGSCEVACPPAPDAPFRLRVGDPLDRVLAGRLAPAPGTPASFTFSFGSCNLSFVEGREGIALAPAAGIYDAMARDLDEADARFALWIGDQVYADGLRSRSVSAELAASGAREVPEPQAALAAYRRMQRLYLGVPGFAALRARLPSLCLWDDHEICDDFGVRRGGSPREQRLFDAACRAYCEYQHARNPSAAFGAPPYPWRFVHGDSAFLGLDARSARDHAQGRVLDAAQWDDLAKWLHGEEAASVATVFAVSALPVAHAARWFVRLFERAPARLASAVRDRWCSSSFLAERDRLLRALFDWQSAAPHRQVFLLSGDVHSASAFTLRRRTGPGVIRQLTSSALTSPIDCASRILSRVAARGGSWLEPDLLVERHFLDFRNNFGLVRVAALPAGGHAVRFEVRAFDPASGTLATAGRLLSRP